MRSSHALNFPCAWESHATHRPLGGGGGVESFLWRGGVMIRCTNVGHFGRWTLMRAVPNTIDALAYAPPQTESCSHTPNSDGVVAPWSVLRAPSGEVGIEASFTSVPFMPRFTILRNDPPSMLSLPGQGDGTCLHRRKLQGGVTKSARRSR